MDEGDHAIIDGATWRITEVEVDWGDRAVIRVERACTCQWVQVTLLDRPAEWVRGETCPEHLAALAE